jgi:hypothetical protein
MDYKELPPTCDFCSKTLRSPRFYLKSCRYEPLKVGSNFHVCLCEACYTPIHDAIKTAVRERIKQVFLEVTAQYRQDWQKAAEKDIGTQP